MSAPDIEPVTLEIDDVTIKFRGQWVEEPAEGEDGDGDDR